MHENEFIFTGIVYKENDSYSSVCPELDVASEGNTLHDASSNLLEAVTLYLETAIEANLPYLRPIPQAEDPRINQPDSIVKTFNLKVYFNIKAYA